MARVYYGPTVADAAGKVAGSVFSHWRGVQYVKRFAKPGNPNTSLQQAIRNAFKFLTTVWKVLPAEIVAAWTTYAKGKKFTNRNAFLGEGTPSAPLTTDYPLTPHNPLQFPAPTITQTPGADQNTITWTYPSTDANQRARVYRQYIGVAQCVFVSEETYPTASKVVTGFTGTGSAVFWVVLKDSVSGRLAKSIEIVGTWT